MGELEDQEQRLTTLLRILATLDETKAIDACIDAILNVVDSFEVFCDIRARDAASEAAARAEEQEP